MTPLAKLSEISEGQHKTLTTGLRQKDIEKFLEKDSRLETAIDMAYEQFQVMKKNHPELLRMDEDKLIETLQAQFLNFYPESGINPYVPLGAKGPWIVTSHGAVVHDSGGYGMLGAGHAPTEVLSTIEDSQVMANIMTANVHQFDFAEAMNRELGHNRPTGNPYSQYLCLNSGSEAMTLALRLADLNSQLVHDRVQFRSSKMISLVSSFHGRTDRPAHASDSCLKTYKKCLHSFKQSDNLICVPINDTSALEQAFKTAKEQEVFIEACLMEPVMGEGDPGMGITPAFYTRARELCTENQSLLIIDSIQAGLRAHGVLSLVDYPGFENLPAPDIESFSKALNAGQYPLSVLAVSDKIAASFQKGIYGNTMTANPRALQIATAVLKSITPKIRKNIVEKGAEAVQKLQSIAAQLPHIVTKVQGTGLLFSIEIVPERKKVVGFGGLEEQLRKMGIGVIHGGENSLRFTPTFMITSEEIDLICEYLTEVLKE